MDIIESILTETESAIDRQVRDISFCYELMEQHREMEEYVNECLVIASGNKKVINEMYILNEAAIGDKIKGFFTKIKNFFKKIFDKLFASMNGLFLEQKKYVDKYADIITKCKWQLGDVNNMKDRFVGLARIIDAVDNAENAIIGTNMDKYFGDKAPDDNFIDPNLYASAESIENAYKDDKYKAKAEIGATRNETFNDFIQNGQYWKNVDGFDAAKQTDNQNNVDVGKTFATWFDGSEEDVSYTPEQVEDNFQTIINVVYAGSSYLKKLESIVSNVNNKMDKAAKNMEDYHKAQKDKILQAVKGKSNATDEKPTDGSSDEKSDNPDLKEENEANKKVDNAEQTAKTTADKVDKETNNSQKATPVKVKKVNAEAWSSLSSFDRFNYYIVETPGFSNNSSSSSSSSTVKGPAGAGSQQINNAGNANTNINKMKTATMNSSSVKNTEGVNDNNKDDLEKKANELLNIDITNRETKINEAVNISTTIANKIFECFTATNKDFYAIIRAHVQWYLANPGKKDDPECKASRVKNLNMNAGTESVKQTNTTAKPQNKPEQTEGNTETNQEGNTGNNT